MWQTQRPVSTIKCTKPSIHPEPILLSILLYIAIVLVLYNAGPLDVSWAVSSDKVVAILESYFPAQVRPWMFSQ